MSGNYKTAGLIFSSVAGRYSIGAVNHFEEGDRQKDLMNHCSSEFRRLDLIIINTVHVRDAYGYFFSVTLIVLF
jgi:hypothetical protein